MKQTTEQASKRQSAPTADAPAVKRARKAASPPTAADRFTQALTKARLNDLLKHCPTEVAGVYLLELSEALSSEDRGKTAYKFGFTTCLDRLMSEHAGEFGVLDTMVTLPAACSAFTVDALLKRMLGTRFHHAIDEETGLLLLWPAERDALRAQMKTEGDALFAKVTARIQQFEPAGEICYELDIARQQVKNEALKVAEAKANAEVSKYKAIVAQLENAATVDE